MDLRFPGLARSSNGTGDAVIKRLTGYSAVREGDDWVVRGTDPQLVKGPMPVLIADATATELSENRYSEIATRFCERYQTEFDDLREPWPQPEIAVNGRFGFQSQLLLRRHLMFFSKRPFLFSALAKNILPFMKDHASATAVCPVKINATTQYGIVGIAKISYLAKKFGFEKARELVQERKAMSSVLPSAIDVLSYLEALLTFVPFAVTLSLDHLGSQLHFFNDGLWAFPLEATKGLFELSNTRQSPVVELGRRPLTTFTADLCREYFVAAVQAINNLVSYINNPTNFPDASGEFDELRFLKTQSGIHLLFADLNSLNYTNSAHLQAKAAFSFVDKMANLKASISGKAAKEDNIFQILLSSDMGSRIVQIFDGAPLNASDELRRVMKEAAGQVYSGMHSHMSLELPEGITEKERLDRLRTFRNMSHGTFLRGDGFERAFVDSAATVPSELMYVPILLAWALCLDPQQVLNFES